MFFLYHRTTAPTGRVLAKALDVPHGTAVRDREDLIIRWGSEVRTTYRPDDVLNNRDAIHRASDKLQSLEMLRGRGVPVPNFSCDPRYLRAPYLGRNSHHTRGQDIILCMQLADAFRCESEYFVEYVPVAREYRVHVFNDEVIHQAEKVWTEGEYTPWIRNHSHGHVFRSPSVRLNLYQKAVVIDAVKNLRLNFGAVDLIVSDDGLPFVLEVNTAPACSPRTARAYVAAMVEWIYDNGYGLVEPDYEILESLRGDDESNDPEGAENADYEDDLNTTFSENAGFE